jgi:hypothetical protein
VRIHMAILLLAMAGQTLANTTITYQGHLADDGQPFTGNVEMEFQLFGAATGGTAVSGSLAENVSVAGGLFQTDLNFGEVFDGSERWLEIRVDGQVLQPRQAIRAAPVAMFALDADALEGRLAADLQTLTFDAHVRHFSQGVLATFPASSEVVSLDVSVPEDGVLLLNYGMSVQNFGNDALVVAELVQNDLGGTPHLFRQRPLDREPAVVAGRLVAITKQLNVILVLVGRGAVEHRTGPEHARAVRLAREETFGPTLPVMKVRDAEEGVRLANDSQYGLQASVWTKDPAKGERLARMIEAGVVTVNDAQINYVALELPMGGWKESGLGSRHGADGIRKYTKRQALLVTRFAPKRDLHMFPYKARTTKLIERMLRLVYGRGKR